jgi:TrmH family RNA methyltransferase
MLSKSQISFINSLHQKKFRKEHQLFIAEGEKVVAELLSSSFKVKRIFCTPPFIQKYENRKKDNSTEWTVVTEDELKKISALTTPNEVVAVAEIPSYQMDESELKNSLSFVLDDVNDPGNLGTIIRIADWFGIRNVICSSQTADCYNPKAAQASMGSLFRVKVHYTDLEKFFESNRRGNKIPVYGASLQGEIIYSTELSSHGVIVLGSESKGFHENITKYFTRHLYIPSFPSGSSGEIISSPDSLNVAVAAAIVCSEFRRRSFDGLKK